MLFIPSVLIYFHKSEVSRGDRGSVRKCFIVESSILAILESNKEYCKEQSSS